MEITGEKVVLVPATPAHKELFYQWATQSDGTKFWYGELYMNEIPDKASFFEDWKDHYFDEEKPHKGRIFLIRAQNEYIGIINYNELTEEELDLDIFIAADVHKNRGYGTDSIQTLTTFLHQQYGIACFQVHAIASNPRAIKAYQKAGFQIKEIYIDENNLVWNKLTRCL